MVSSSVVADDLVRVVPVDRVFADDVDRGQVLLAREQVLGDRAVVAFAL